MKNLHTRGAALALAIAASTAFMGSAAIAQDSTGKGLTIGWSQRGISGSDWWKTMVAGGEAAAAEIGATLIVLDANGDTTRQNEDIRTLVTRGVDVMVVNPNDPIGLTSAVRMLKREGIPLVAVNSNLADSLVPDLFCYVAEDQFATGALAGNVIGEEVIKRWGDDATVKLGSIGGFPGDILSDLRFDGFMSGYNNVMAAYPNVKTTILAMKFGEWKPDKALAPVRDMATANPDLNVFYSMSDVMLGGINQGFKLAGIYGDGLLIGSYDGGMNAIKQMVDESDGPLRATASNQPWDQAQLAVKMAVAAFNGDQSACPDKTNFVETIVVTPETAEQYYDSDETYVRSGD
jgi:ribose transport system substrate-binding protein